MTILSRMAKAAERRQMPVADPGTVQRLRKRAGVELRVEARPWHRAHVNDKRNALGLKKRDERFHTPVGVTDGVKG